MIRFSILLLALALIGCGNPSTENHAEVESTEPPTIESPPEPAEESEDPEVDEVIAEAEPVVEERAPFYAAQLFLESSAEGIGTVRFSGSMHSSYRSKTTVGETSMAKSYAEETSKHEYTLADGRVCVIVPYFVERRDLQDIWELSITFKDTEANGGGVLAEFEKEVAFDNSGPVVVVEGVDLTIDVRPPESR